MSTVHTVALAFVRDGVLPAGADAAADDAGGMVVLVGTGVAAACDALRARRIVAGECEWHGRLDAAVAAVQAVGATRVILPATPDGRDAAPRLAARLGWDLVAGAVSVDGDAVVVSRHDGRVVEEHALLGPAVITLIPRAVAGRSSQDTCEVRSLPAGPAAPVSAVRSVAVDPPDPATIDLAEAPRIVGGGQGLGHGERFVQLARIGRRLGAAMGGTRVASDAGWIPFERQIGTTGVIVKPSLYLAFGVSGATQHTSGLGHPDHVVSVNTDPSCPMMAMADLAIVSDAPAVLDALEKALEKALQKALDT